MVDFDFEPVVLPTGIPEFRAQIREFLAQELTHIPPQNKCNSWAEFDKDFSLKLGAKGWIGMIWPAQSQF